MRSRSCSVTTASAAKSRPRRSRKSTQPGAIPKILTHLGEPLEPPLISPARGPPTDWGDLVQVHDDRDVCQASDRRAASGRLRGRRRQSSRLPQRTLRCPAQCEITIAAKGSGQRVRRRNNEQPPQARPARAMA
jgi:hypothetical protein